MISGEISIHFRFQQRFHGSQRTVYSQGTLRGAGASATEFDAASARVCIVSCSIAMKYSIYGHVLLDRVCWGCSRGCYCCSLARQPYFSLLLVSRYRKLPRRTDFTGILQRCQDQSIHSRNNFDIIMSY